MQQKPPSRKHSVSKTSNNWKKEHFDDQYVKQSWQDGYRSRASYKLLELDEKDKLFRNGMTIIDLGAAPGGWSQIAAEKVGPEGVVIASDILEMDALAGVDFIQGDFTEESVLNAILERLGNRPVDLVMSDMAPNMSGMAAIDQPQAMYLVELALEARACDSAWSTCDARPSRRRLPAFLRRPRFGKSSSPFFVPLSVWLL